MQMRTVIRFDAKAHFSRCLEVRQASSGASALPRREHAADTPEPFRREAPLHIVGVVSEPALHGLIDGEQLISALRYSFSCPRCALRAGRSVRTDGGAEATFGMVVHNLEVVDPRTESHPRCSIASPGKARRAGTRNLLSKTQALSG